MRVGSDEACGWVPVEVDLQPEGGVDHWREEDDVGCGGEVETDGAGAECEYECIEAALTLWHLKPSDRRLPH